MSPLLVCLHCRRLLVLSVSPSSALRWCSGASETVQSGPSQQPSPRGPLLLSESLIRRLPPCLLDGRPRWYVSPGSFQLPLRRGGGQRQRRRRPDSDHASRRADESAHQADTGTRRSRSARTNRQRGAAAGRAGAGVDRRLLTIVDSYSFDLLLRAACFCCPASCRVASQCSCWPRRAIGPGSRTGQNRQRTEQVHTCGWHASVADLSPLSSPRSSSSSTWPTTSSRMSATSPPCWPSTDEATPSSRETS